MKKELTKHSIFAQKKKNLKEKTTTLFGNFFISHFTKKKKKYKNVKKKGKRVQVFLV